MPELTFETFEAKSCRRYLNTDGCRVISILVTELTQINRRGFLHSVPKGENGIEVTEHLAISQTPLKL